MFSVYCTYFVIYHYIFVIILVFHDSFNFIFAKSLPGFLCDFNTKKKSLCLSQNRVSSYYNYTIYRNATIPSQPILLINTVVRSLFRNMNIMRVTFLQGCCGNFYKFSCFLTVSYTHLDVYKRQKVYPGRLVLPSVFPALVRLWPLRTVSTVLEMCIRDRHYTVPWSQNGYISRFFHNLFFIFCFF